MSLPQTCGVELDGYLFLSHHRVRILIVDAAVVERDPCWLSGADGLLVP